MKSKYFNRLILGLIILIPIFYFGIFNSKVSLQYETNDPGDCVSQISGRNLCQDIEQMKILIAIDIIVIVLLMLFRKKIIRD
ncbi:hypothetical protein J3D55_001019 [Chryseobacterium ginsenosidimutans]|uniref:hypothetical protein n=1 Tax=Chryseobacterium ginsenosidimutans TaxID=687846 RepID=UPI002167CF59|nr:hypothetical protein [Chryseobacterium ginsenosidimutans]MCS3868103.1 hypothetical protein [Chryseobacterium ginsenosidimutans]